MATRPKLRLVEPDERREPDPPMSRFAPSNEEPKSDEPRQGPIRDVVEVIEEGLGMSGVFLCLVAAVGLVMFFRIIVCGRVW